MSKLMSAVISCYTAKRWFNDGDYCNRKTHPGVIPYRRYRRGKARCLECGAKVGRGIYKRQGFDERMADNLFRPNPFLAWLKERG